MEIIEDSLRRIFTLERQFECFARAVARREISFKEIRHWMECQVPDIEGWDLMSDAWLTMCEYDYGHIKEDEVIRDFCKLTHLPYDLPTTTATSVPVYVETTFR